MSLLMSVARLRAVLRRASTFDRDPTCTIHMMGEALVCLEGIPSRHHCVTGVGSRPHPERGAPRGGWHDGRGCEVTSEGDVCVESGAETLLR